MVYIFVTTGDKREITIVKAENIGRGRELAGVLSDESYSLSLSESDLDTLKTNNEVLIR